MVAILRRNLIAAFFSSVILIIYIDFYTANKEPLSPYTFNSFVSWGFFLSLYVFPIVFVYGIGVSTITELTLTKLRAFKYIRTIISGLIHISAGYLFGYVFQSQVACIYGATCAAIYFLANEALRFFWNKTKKSLINVVWCVPILIFGSLAGYFYMVSPNLPPFTENNAVAFATSGKGTNIELFPKQVGKMNLIIDGYNVERETSVTRIEKETFEVTFTERWSKEGKSGQTRSNFIVERYSSMAHGGGGDMVPYKTDRP
jgi:hypothetical protein